MKTVMKKVGYAVLCTVALVLSACGKNNDNNNQSYYPSSTYSLSNGQCYMTGTSTPVPLNYCTNSGINNGICYQPGTSIPIACNNGIPGVGGVAGQKVCTGWFYYTSGGASQLGYCNGQNCRGYTMIEYSTNQQWQCI